MNNPLDNVIDLGLVNYVRHPSNPDYVVFRFSDPNRAASFAEQLNSQGIWFEKGEDEKRGRKIEMFGIHRSDYEKASKINITVEAKHRKHLIHNKPLKYFVLVFGLSALLLSIIGYCSTQNHLQSVNKQLRSIDKH